MGRPGTRGTPAGAPRHDGDGRRGRRRPSPSCGRAAPGTVDGVPALAVSEYVTWAGTLAVMAFFALMAYRATRTRPEDREADAATRAEDDAVAQADAATRAGDDAVREADEATRAEDKARRTG